MALKRPGPYVGLSANYADDEKIMAAGEDAELLYVRMLAYCARTPLTEGWISDPVLVSRLGVMPRTAYDEAGNETGNVPGTDAASRAERLREVGLIERDGTGWRITAWLKWNRSIEEMGRERTRDQRRKAAPTSNDPETGREAGRERGRETATTPGNNDQDQDQDQPPGSGKTRPDPKNERPDILTLCRHLSDRLTERQVRHTITEEWKNAARLMLDKDGRDISEVRELIDWSSEDEFWSANVLSMPTFRKQYDKLRLRAKPHRDQGQNLWDALRERGA